MSHLSSTLIGKAKDAIKDLMLLTTSDPDDINTLWRTFERPDIIIIQLLNKIRKTDVPMEGDYASLSNFTDAVRNYIAIVNNLQLLAEFNCHGRVDTEANRAILPALGPTCQ